MAMWRAFQAAAAESVGVVTSAGAPTEARWALTSVRTAPARSARAAGQSPGVQLPPAVPETAGVTSVAAAAATMASRKNGDRRWGVRTGPPSEPAPHVFSPFWG